MRSAAATCARLSPPTIAGRTVLPCASNGTTAFCCAETPMACTPSSSPPPAASPSDNSQACGSTSEARPPPSVSVSTGCGAYPCLSTDPVSVSQTTIRVKSGELSNPATIPMAEILPYGGRWRRRVGTP